MKDQVTQDILVRVVELHELVCELLEQAERGHALRRPGDAGPVTGSKVPDQRTFDTATQPSGEVEHWRGIRKASEARLRRLVQYLEARLAAGYQPDPEAPATDQRWTGGGRLHVQYLDQDGERRYG